MWNTAARWTVAAPNSACRHRGLDSRKPEMMSDTLGLLEESLQLARDLGYCVREEPLGDLPGGDCWIGGAAHILLNLEQPSAQRLNVLLRVLAGNLQTQLQPMSRLLKSRIEALRE